MKVLVLLFFIFPTLAQMPQDFRDILSGSALEQYEKMMQQMQKDMEALDQIQLEEYNQFFNKNLLLQLQMFGGQRSAYSWSESESERILKFSGRLDEEAPTKIEIKDGNFEIKGTFIKETNTNGHKNISKTLVELKVSLPRDIDASRVRYENKENLFTVIFPKIGKADASTSPKKPKPLRSPLKKNSSDLTI
ncbi:hypothetical protein BMS_1626 [Halobacteriovorax marinus SJ]|uniref:SHSP domain-containing protein n=1 Tax=Halobacteriovorax marinus (strain ATCC BAA-682 / DSM 15412 / SJ) TaxID=862908 RepID=E1X0Y1_HALMS|nr:Hsp20/alpha crystallin family protein [Halobacteriovorax marinus]CBW26470.1 hypothetical protein BMS_1626 [Halobacteriovorax marinus SJ]